MSEKEHPRIPGKEPAAPPLARRFYKHAGTAQLGTSAGEPLYSITLDGRPVRTPGKRPLAVRQKALAEAIAAEWEAQGERIDPASMPLTRLANTIIDGVIGREAEVRGDILKYAASDLLCYRAGGPEGLVRRQRAAWDPVLAWARARLGVRLVLTEGVMPVGQPAHALEAVAAALAPFDAWQLASLHVMTTLTGSALLALAHAHGAITIENAWAAAHVDEDWQIEQWGQDAEAAERRRFRSAELASASQLFQLVNPL